MSARTWSSLSLLLAACGGEPEPDGHEHPHEHDVTAAAWFFSADAASNTWQVDLVDPAAGAEPVRSFTVDDLALLSGSEEAGGNGLGPSWGDAVVATSGDRVFVNATNVDKVAVFDTQSLALEALLDVGSRPVHAWNPNHGIEVWTHADGPGAFYVIDQSSLSVSDPVVAALENTGHGKLAYAEELGTSYYATNTNDPGAFPIDGDSRTVGDILPLCGVPCTDDPYTPEDESTETCGGTHDKGYNAATNQVFFECSGDARGHFAFVDAATNAVTMDLVPISGAVAHSEDNAYILVIDAGTGHVGVWDTSAPTHDGVTFDAELTIDGEPSARGTRFHVNENGDREAWIPQSGGDAVAILNLSTLEVEEVVVGGVTAPEEGHFSRQGGIGGGTFFTFNDDGPVMVDLETRAVVQGPALGGLVSRIVWVEHGHE